MSSNREQVFRKKLTEHVVPKLEDAANMFNTKSSEFNIKEPVIPFLLSQLKLINSQLESGQINEQEALFRTNQLRRLAVQRLAYLEENELKPALDLAKESAEAGGVSVHGEYRSLRDLNQSKERALLKTYVNSFNSEDILNVETIDNWLKSMFESINKELHQNISSETNNIINAIYTLIAEINVHTISKEDQVRKVEEIRVLIEERVNDLQNLVGEQRTQLSVLEQRKNTGLIDHNRYELLKQRFLDNIDQYSYEAEFIKRFYKQIAESDIQTYAGLEQQERDRQDKAAKLSKAEAEERANLERYELFFLLITEVRDRIRIGNLPLDDFFDFPELNLTRNDPEAPLILKRFLEDVFSGEITPEKQKKKIKIFHDIERFVVLHTKKILNNSLASKEPALPGEKTSIYSSFIEITGDPEMDRSKKYDEYLNRFPPEISSIFAEYKMTYLALALSHDAAALYEQRRSSQTKVSIEDIKSLLQQKGVDGNMFEELLGSAFLDAMFGGQIKLLENDRTKEPTKAFNFSNHERELMDTVGHLSTLTSFAMGAWQEGSKQEREGAKEKESGNRISADVPYSSGNPEQLRKQVLNKTLLQYATWLEEKGLLRQPNSPGEEPINRLSLSQREMADYAVRQAFIYHRILLNELKADTKSKNETISQMLNASTYHEGGKKTIDDPTSSKDLLPDVSTVHEYTVTLGEYSKGWYIIPFEAIDRSFTWAKLISELRSAHGLEKASDRDLVTDKRFREIFGVFTEDQLFNGTNTIQVDSLSKYFTPIRIHPKYRVLNANNRKAVDFTLIRSSSENFITKVVGADGANNNVAIKLSLNDVLYRLRLSPHYVGEDDQPHRSVQYDGSFTSNLLDEYMHLLSQAEQFYMNYSHEDTEEQYLRSIQTIAENITIRRIRGPENITLVADSHLRNLRGSLSRFLRGLNIGQDNQVISSMKLTEDEEKAIDDAVNESLADELKRVLVRIFEGITYDNKGNIISVPRLTPAERRAVNSIHRKVRERIIVDPEEISTAEFSNTWKVSDLYEKTVTYYITPIRRSTPNWKHVGEGRGNVGPADQFVIQDTIEKEDMDLFYRMYRDPGKSPEEDHPFMHPEMSEYLKSIEVMNHYLRRIESGIDPDELPEAFQNKEDIIKRKEELWQAINIEAVLVPLQTYLNHYIYAELKESAKGKRIHINNYKVLNVETITAIGELTPDLQVLTEELFASFVDVIIAPLIRSSVDDSGQIQAEILSANYSREAMRQRVLAIQERLGLSESLEAAIVLYKWLNLGGLTNLVGATSVDPQQITDKRLIKQIDKLTRKE